MKNFSRGELEAIKMAATEGLLPHGFMGFGKVSPGDLADQLLRTMDENAQLQHTLMRRDDGV